jgi:hypothetical protein
MAGFSSTKNNPIHHTKYQNMKHLISLLLVSVTWSTANAQVGIGIQQPQATLDVNGTLKIGAVANGTPAKGTIRWNDGKSDFEGYNGFSWVSLTGGKSGWGNQQSYSYESSASNQFLDQNSAQNGTELGSALAIYGDLLVAGAFRDIKFNEINKWGQGSVRIFKRSGDRWTQWNRMNDPDGNINDYFGKSVGISATHLIAGAPNAQNASAASIGKAYVYEYNESTYLPPVTLTASDAQDGDNFGNAVAIDGNYAAVGAPGNDISGVLGMGRAYVFQRNGSLWPQMSIITAPDGTAYDNFGYTITVKGDLLVIASPFKKINNLSNAGKVYVYRQSGSGWGLIASLVSPIPTYNERFGFSLCLHGDKLIVGSPSDYSINMPESGKVYVYTVQSNSVTYHSTVADPLGVPGDGFGTSVSMYNDVLIAGSRYANVLSALYQGKASVFRWTNNNWQHEATLTAARVEPYMYFGTAVAIGQWGAMVGGPWADYHDRKDNGEVFFYKK